MEVWRDPGEAFNGAQKHVRAIPRLAMPKRRFWHGEAREPYLSRDSGLSLAQAEAEETTLVRCCWHRAGLSSPDNENQASSGLC
jgi:hypothetical protein